jgi:hypothetical protein
MPTVREYGEVILGSEMHRGRYGGRLRDVAYRRRTSWRSERMRMLRFSINGMGSSCMQVHGGIQRHDSHVLVAVRHRKHVVTMTQPQPKSLRP